MSVVNFNNNKQILWVWIQLSPVLKVIYSKTPSSYDSLRPDRCLETDMTQQVENALLIIYIIHQMSFYLTHGIDKKHFLQIYNPILVDSPFA